MPDWADEAALKCLPCAPVSPSRVVAIRQKIAAALREAAARERQACAVLVEKQPVPGQLDPWEAEETRNALAAAIRARATPP